MRHAKRSKKLGRSSAHRDSLLAGLVCGVIEHKRVKTTLTRARLARVLAERMVTLGKAGTLAARRRAVSTLRRKRHVKILFEEIAPRCAGRAGGYTRIVKLGPRTSDAAPMAYLEWVDVAPAPKRKRTKKEKQEKKGQAAGR